MTPWAERPSEVANLLNPAFCGLLLREAVSGYESATPAGMPFPLAFLVLPVVLHEATRGLLPGTTRTSLHAWLQENPQARVNFAERARELNPWTREALLYLAARGAVRFAEGGVVRAAGKLSRGRTALEEGSAEVKLCLQKAKLVGKWFALAGDTATVFQMWGVRP